MTQKSWRIEDIWIYNRQEFTEAMFIIGKIWGGKSPKYALGESILIFWDIVYKNNGIIFNTIKMDQLGLYVSVWVSQTILSEKCKLHNMIFISTSYWKYPLPGFICVSCHLTPMLFYIITGHGKVLCVNFG